MDGGEKQGARNFPEARRDFQSEELNLAFRRGHDGDDGTGVVGGELPGSAVRRDGAGGGGGGALFGLRPDASPDAEQELFRRLC